MLKIANMVASVAGTNVLSLGAKAGESILIRHIDFRIAAAAAENIAINIDRKRIQQWIAPAGWFLLANLRSTGYRSIYQQLWEKDLLAPIPVAEGETLSITAPGTNNFISVLYDVYDASDIKNTMKNGSKGNAYDLPQVISNAGVRATAGDLALNQSDLDVLFPQFPGGDIVPSKMELSLKALFGVAAAKGTGTANGEFTTKLKMLRDREDILDANLVGIDFLGNAAYTTAATNYQTLVGRISGGQLYVPPQLFLFDNPIQFNAGSELNVYATLGRTGAGADFVAGEVKAGLLFEVVQR